MRRLARYGVVVLGVIAACAPPVATVSEDPVVRTVHVAQELALSAITTEFQITEHSDGRVEGRFWATSGSVNRRTIEQWFGCRAKVETDDARRWVCVPPRARIDWRVVLSDLDAAGVMAPPPDDTPRWTLCSDGAPWYIVAHRYAQADSIKTSQGCAPAGQRRLAFQRAVDSVIAHVVHQVEPQP